jgi:hypothetical protein
MLNSLPRLCQRSNFHLNRRHCSGGSQAQALVQD